MRGNSHERSPKVCPVRSAHIWNTSFFNPSVGGASRMFYVPFYTPHDFYQVKYWWFYISQHVSLPYKDTIEIIRHFLWVTNP